MNTTLKLAACVATMATATIAYTAVVQTQAGPGTRGEWRDYGGDKGMTKYSPLDQITKDNVTALAHRLASSRSCG